MYLAPLAAATVAGSLLRFLDAGLTGFSSARGLGATIGAGITLFLVAALVPTLVLLLRKEEGRRSIS